VLVASIVAMLRSLIDLHTHTTFSDGSQTPAKLIELAAASGCRAIAITDHDTVAGLAEGRGAACLLGIEFVEGVEISAEYDRGTMHILGYYVDDRSEDFRSSLDKLKEAREARNLEIVRRLQSLGFDISYEEVAKLAGSEVVGRPHFAHAMLQKGYVKSIQEAFDRFLAKGAPAYVEKQRLSPADAIKLIHDAGGVAVLAHPYQLNTSSLEELEQLVCDLVEVGLDGIEAIYSRHGRSEQDNYVQLAARYGLLVTGGSDYHGIYKPDIRLIKGMGDLEVHYEVLEEVKRRAGWRQRSRLRQGNE
jgi:predicted metal-dependent phosphoesterase TrpH